MASRKHVQLSRAALADMDPAELEAAGKLGARRFRRWANDRILRDLAGKLTAEDMQGLFSPVPFGNAPVKSALQLASEPRAYAIWESFVSIDMDRQARVLEKWEAHIREERRLGRLPSRVPPEVKALQAWGKVSRKARHGLRQASLAAVEALEAEVLAAKEEGEVGLCLSSSFQRLLVHGIAEYHHLLSASRTEGDGTRVTHVKLRRGEAPQAGAGAIGREEYRVAEVLCLLQLREGDEVWLGAHGPAADDCAADAHVDEVPRSPHGAAGDAACDWVVV